MASHLWCEILGWATKLTSIATEDMFECCSADCVLNHTATTNLSGVSETTQTNGDIFFIAPRILMVWFLYSQFFAEEAKNF
jgi:hypothetical protein